MDTNRPTVTARIDTWYSLDKVRIVVRYQRYKAKTWTSCYLVCDTVEEAEHNITPFRTFVAEEGPANVFEYVKRVVATNGEVSG